MSAPSFRLFFSVIVPDAAVGVKPVPRKKIPAAENSGGDLPFVNQFCSASFSSAARAAVCSASFLLRPVPAESGSPLSSTAASKILA